MRIERILLSYGKRYLGEYMVDPIELQRQIDEKRIAEIEAVKEDSKSQTEKWLDMTTNIGSYMSNGEAGIFQAGVQLGILVEQMLKTIEKENGR